MMTMVRLQTSSAVRTPSLMLSKSLAWETTMARKPETRLQQKIQRAIWAEWPKSYVRKIHVSEFQSGGIADLLCCIQGYFFAIEVKMPGEEMSELQEAEAIEVKLAEGVTFVATSVGEAIRGIKDGLARKTAARTSPRR